jgi:hypothetical protein
MPVEITLPDKTKVRTDHLPVGVIAEAAKKAETNWAHLTEAPWLGDGFAMIFLYEGACKHAGQAVPDGLTAGQLADLLVAVDGDDRPTEYVDGMPDPQPPESPEEGSSATT